MTKYKNKYFLILIALLIIIALSTTVYILSSKSSNSCRASQGYICKNAVLSYNGPNLTVTIGQDTGKNWTNVETFFSYEVNVSGAAIIFGSATPRTFIGNMDSGKTQTVNVFYNEPTYPDMFYKGKQINGSIWVFYDVNGNLNDSHILRFANVSVKAT